MDIWQTSARQKTDRRHRDGYNAIFEGEKRKNHTKVKQNICKVCEEQ